MKHQVLVLCLLAAAFRAAAAPPPCAADAVPQARKLLSFHTGGDDRADVDDRVRVLAPLTNPANRAQKLTVLEVMGSVYKTDYRIRLIYHPVGAECLLMGQEILELSSP